MSGKTVRIYCEGGCGASREVPEILAAAGFSCADCRAKAGPGGIKGGAR